MYFCNETGINNKINPLRISSYQIICFGVYKHWSSASLTRGGKGPRANVGTKIDVTLRAKLCRDHQLHPLILLGHSRLA